MIGGKKHNNHIMQLVKVLRTTDKSPEGNMLMLQNQALFFIYFFSFKKDQHTGLCHCKYNPSYCIFIIRNEIIVYKFYMPVEILGIQ